MEALLSQLNSIDPLSKGLEIHLQAILKKKLFKKGDMILKEGQVSKNIYFIKAGLIRGFKWKKSKEVTMWIMKEGDIIISPVSFLEQTPSEEAIIALEKCEVWGISYEELQNIYKEFRDFNLHGRVITEKYYIRNAKWQSFLSRSTAKEKYLLLLQNDPELIKRVPSKYLASYINVTPETLSKIRSEISNGD